MDQLLTVIKRTADLIVQASQLEPQIRKQLERSRTNQEYRQELFVDTLILTANTLSSNGLTLTKANAAALKAALVSAMESDAPSLQAMVGLTSLFVAQLQPRSVLYSRYSNQRPGSLFPALDRLQAKLKHRPHA